MKRILAMLLALAMLLTCASALAEANLQDGFTVTGSISLNADEIMALIPADEDGNTAVGIPSSMLTPLLQNAAAIINALTVRAAINQQGANAQVYLKDTSILELNAAENEGSLVIAVDAIPDYAFTVSAETLEQIMSSVTSAANQLPAGVDPEALTQAILPHVEALMTELTSKVGEAEMGEFTVGEYTYNVKTPINVTTKELVAIFGGFLKGILAEEAIQPILAMAGEQVNVEEITAQIDAIAEGDEADMPVTTMALYVNMDQEGNTDRTMFVVDMTKDEQSINVQAGMVDNAVVVYLDILGQKMYIAMMPNENDGATLTIDTAVSGMQITLVLDFSVIDGISTISGLVALFGNLDSPVFSFTLAVEMNAEVAPVDVEGKTLVAVEEIMADPSGDAANAVSDAIQNAVSTLLTKAMTAMPQEISAIMSVFMPSTEGQSAVEE